MRRQTQLTHAQRGRPLYPHTVGEVRHGEITCAGCGYHVCSCQRVEPLAYHLTIDGNALGDYSHTVRWPPSGSGTASVVEGVDADPDRDPTQWVPGDVLRSDVARAFAIADGPGTADGVVFRSYFRDLGTLGDEQTGGWLSPKHYLWHRIRRAGEFKVGDVVRCDLFGVGPPEVVQSTFGGFLHCVSYSVNAKVAILVRPVEAGEDT